MKKLYKIGIITTICIVIIVAAVALLVSPLTKRYIVKNSKELTGHQITMDKLRFNIFSGRLHITDFKMAEQNDSASLFSLADFDMNIRLLPLLGSKVQIDKIALTRPDLRIYQQDSIFNFSDLLDRFASDTTNVEPSDGNSWDIGIYNISLAEGRILYKDVVLDAKWDMNNLNLTIPGVYFSGQQTDIGVVLNFAEGGSLETSLAYDIETSDYNIDLKLKNLALDNTLPYLQQTLNINDINGLLSADMTLKGNSASLLSLHAQGKAEVSGFALHDQNSGNLMSVDTMCVVLADADLQNMNYRLDRLYISGFSTQFELRKDGTNNFSNLMKPASATPATTTVTTPSTSAMKLHIAELAVVNGDVVFHDKSVARPFDYHMSAISVNGKNFDMDSRNKLDISAKIQKTGMAKIRWEGSLSDINNQNIMVSFSNLALKDFSPYCEHYTAYPITNGNMSFRSQNIISGGYLNGTNHLDMFEPKVDKKLKELKPEFKVPLKLGLYILKDKKGHVNIDLPVKGRINSPEFSYRKIIIKTIGNVLLKVVTAPFSFLMGHSENMEYINIEALQPDFSSEQYTNFDKLAQILKDKPELKIELIQKINYAKTVQNMSHNNLKMAYYNHINKLADTVARKQFTMIDYENIAQIDHTSAPVVALADSLLRLNGIEPLGVDRHQKSLMLYENLSRTQVDKIMSMRNSKLQEYMVTMQSVAPNNLKIISADSLQLQSYTGKDRYTIAVEVDGERVEQTDQPSEEPTESKDATVADSSTNDNTN